MPRARWLLAVLTASAVLAAQSIVHGGAALVALSARRAAQRSGGTASGSSTATNSGAEMAAIDGETPGRALAQRQASSDDAWSLNDAALAAQAAGQAPAQAEDEGGEALAPAKV